MGPCSGEENVWTWWLVMTLHHLSKLLHHEFSGLDRQGSVLALFHIGHVILDELTPLPQIPHLINNIYPEDVFPPPPFL